ncbi:MAG TPA: malto-oligosyltrehalose synthase, partial [Polyangiaceae bacterium]|nr:malto-oligosyltrehalose synthase [Polyangiaceae bacterium]
MIPGSTYRIQLHAAFTLRDALGIVPYLAELGIDWLYCSPLFMSRPGSEHGYDVVDPTRIDPELGSERDLELLVTRLHEHGLGLLLDIVPNHMGTHDTNSWWVDVLEHGPSSPYARFFDIDWTAGDGKVLLPVLGSDVSEVLEARELSVERDRDRYWLRYFDNRFPLRLPIELRNHPPGPLDPERGSAVLEGQAYRLMRWSARRALNYRRFFEINELIGLRVEDPVVFESVHATLFEWLSRGWVSGVRVDHPDGLREPSAYLHALQQATARALARAPLSSGSGQAGQPYVVVEKILCHGEVLRPEWPVQGTTGYEQLNLIGGLLIDPTGAAAIERTYRTFTQQTEGFASVAYESKKQVLRERFSVELARIAAQIWAIGESVGRVSALSRAQVSEALLEVVACFPVYRTYFSAKDSEVRAEDRAIITRTVQEARERAPGLSPDLFQLIENTLLLAPAPLADDASRIACRETLLRFQQLTGPAAAKGVEDTAHYRYVPLTCQNEVGGEPGASGTELSEFHRANQQRAERWPHALTATSTHDTKRSEDVRARIAVLSEIHETWSNALARFRELNQRHKKGSGPLLIPSPNDEYLFYQTLLGVWPDGIDALSADLQERIAAYTLKAAREAKLTTSWTEPNETYEKGLSEFIAAALDHQQNREFLQEFSRFTEPIVRAGRLGALAQTLLKLGCPGVPDFYQGSELWDLSLVDPDNRRPVDFDKRRALLARASQDDSSVPRPFDPLAPDGRAKLRLIARGLELRARQRELFASGMYLPLLAEGARAGHVVAFARTLDSRAVIFVTGRFF